MSTVEELTLTRETFGPAPSAVIGMRLGRSKLIGNVVVLSMILPRASRENWYQNTITRRSAVKTRVKGRRLATTRHARPTSPGTDAGYGLLDRKPGSWVLSDPGSL